MTATNFSIYTIAEGAIVMSFGDIIDDKIMDLIYSLKGKIEKHPFRGYITSVPAYSTLTVFYDPVLFYAEALVEEKKIIAFVSDYISTLLSKKETNVDVEKNVIQIPVKYGGEEGPDLLDVAHMNGLTPDEVVDIHTGSFYRVCMIGFVPGFAYLSGLSHLIYAPRKQTPRPFIPKGSVGIAGSQTGIYPLETPGGWQLIGKTKIELFDANRKSPSLLKAGDTIQFIAGK